MASNVKDKNSRTNRRPRPDENAAERSAVPNPSSESGDLAQNSNPNLCGLFTEEQLEEMSMQKLEFVCKEVISKLVSLGHDEGAALKAVLRNGDWHGEKDVFENIFQNSLSYFDAGNSARSENRKPSFSNLRNFLEFTLAGMVCLLQQVKPHLSKADAMWCLLASELHVARAIAVEIQVLSGSGSSVEGFPNRPVMFPSAMISSRSSLQNEVEYPEKKFNLKPQVKGLLKRNVGVFVVGLRENTKHLQNESQASLGSLKIGDSSSGLIETRGEESLDFLNDDAIHSVLSKFRDLSIQGTETGGIPVDQKDEAILSFTSQIKDLERQVKEHKDWAHQKAMQVAIKLYNNFAELKMLKKERDEAKVLKKGKQAIQDSTMKKFAEMENAFRKASGQVDSANSAVKKLENENAEIRAEMEASKLSASESHKIYMEAVKREKKCLKKFSAVEKQNSKHRDDIAAEMHKISDLQKQLGQAEAGQKEVEVKWRQEQKAKEQGLAQMEEERRNKEADKASIKRMLEAMRLKLEMDFQRGKDDIHLLERELSQLIASEQTSWEHLQSHDLSMQNLNGEDCAIGEAIDHYRRCIICSKDDVSVVFLPCTHQVLCAKCNNGYGKKGKAACLCCQVPIQKRISVFGAAS